MEETMAKEMAAATEEAVAKEEVQTTEDAVREAVKAAHAQAAAEPEGGKAPGTGEEAAGKDAEPENGVDAEAETNAEPKGEDAGAKMDAEPENGKDAGAAGESAGETTEDGKEDMAGGFFGRKFKKELEKKEEELAEQKNSFLRLMAEFDNFRKRTEKEKSGMYDMGAKDVIEKILPVLDNFERGFLLVSEEDKEDPFVQGMEKIYKQFIAVMKELGVKPIDAEGKEFDPNLHNAVMHVEDDNFGENIVVKELQKGYTYKDSVVRHSMVTVAN